jgi:adenine-specific DNA-methyltransferase
MLPQGPTCAACVRESRSSKRGVFAEMTRVPATDALDTAELRKARGAFFTPPALCRYVVDWAIRNETDKVLEPSCGEAAFLFAASDRLGALTATSLIRPYPLHGIELHESSARHAEALIRDAGYDVQVQVSDFFAVEPRPVYDAVVGNPPYVRYQDFTGESRARARAAALRAGVPLSGLASSWAAFTVHSALFLKPGGRLGLVLPAELLTVNYAAEVRRFLMRRFATVRLVLFTERVFPGVLEEVVLLLADGYEGGPTDHCELYQARNVNGLDSAVRRVWKPESPEGKWTPSLLSSEAIAAYEALAGEAHFTTLETWGDTTLGMVTGNNRYFTMSPADVASHGIPKRELLRLSPPGSRHLRGLTLTETAWRELGRIGKATYLFRPKTEPSDAASSYILAGEAAGVNEAYKCRVRRPWWRVPLVPPADLLLTYMNADTPRLCTNQGGVHNLNSVHGVYLRDDMREVGMDLLPLAALNSMTLLGAETVGRAYGGGMLKLEPKEADRLPVPSYQLLESAREDLATLRPQMARQLRNGRLSEAARLVDDLLLVEHCGLKRSEVRALREACADLHARRLARGANPRGED